MVVFREPVAISGQRQVGEVLTVEMVPEVEHAGETRASEFLLRPGTIVVLGVEEQLNPSSNFGTVRFPGRHEPHEGPGGLGFRCRSLSHGRRVGVGFAALTPATVGILNGLQPACGLLHHWIVFGDSDGRETLKALPCAVEVINPPATVPRAARLLATA